MMKNKNIDPTSGEAAFRKAVDILARSMRCEKELYSKLTEYGFNEEAASFAMAECIKKHYVDDFEYAEAAARRMASKGSGVYKVREYLRMKGVKSEAIEHAVREYEVDDRKIMRVLETYLKGRRSPDDIRRARAMLYRRGYRPDEINTAIRALDCDAEEYIEEIDE